MRSCAFAFNDLSTLVPEKDDEKRQYDAEELASTAAHANTTKTGSLEQQHFDHQQHLDHQQQRGGRIISICRRALGEAHYLLASDPIRDKGAALLHCEDTTSKSMLIASMIRKQQPLTSSPLEERHLHDAIVLYNALRETKLEVPSSYSSTPAATLIPLSDDDELYHSKKYQRVIFPPDEKSEGSNNPSEMASSFDEVAYVTATMAVCDISRTFSTKSKVRSALYRNKIMLHDRRRSNTLSKARQSARVRRKQDNESDNAPASRQLDEQELETTNAQEELDLGIFTIDNASFLDAGTMNALMNNSCGNLDTCDSMQLEG